MHINTFDKTKYTNHFQHGFGHITPVYTTVYLREIETCEKEFHIIPIMIFCKYALSRRAVSITLIFKVVVTADTIYLLYIETVRKTHINHHVAVPRH